MPNMVSEERRMSEAGRNNVAESRGVDDHALILSIAPIEFSNTMFRLGRLDPDKESSIDELRRRHGGTHAFRFDHRDGSIANVGLREDIDPLGMLDNANVGEHLLLLAEAIEQELRRWLARDRMILRPHAPLVCLGKRDQLLQKALTTSGVKSPIAGLDVVAKWSFQVRLITPAGEDARPWLGLVADVGTSHIIDLPVCELLKRGVDPRGAYVGHREEADDASETARIRLVGQVVEVEGEELILTDLGPGVDSDRVSAGDVIIEPRRENLEAVVRGFYPQHASQALRRLRGLREPFVSGRGKLEKIAQTIEGFNKSLQSGDRKALRCSFSGNVTARFGRLLDEQSKLFPKLFETRRPGMLFGPNGYDHGEQPDACLTRFGPFQYTHNRTNEPLIVVVCDPAVRGRMDEFIKALRDGVEGENNRFQGGLLGKYRLTKLRFHYKELKTSSADGYLAAVNDALNELPHRPDLALVQIKSSHRQESSGRNPYFVAKARFMRSGVPVQAIRVETVEGQNSSKVYTLNNLALACYAKIGGIPWVISTPGVATHELVIGIGYTEIAGSRLSERARYVGITTLFQGDGRYLVWGTTQETAFEYYPTALLSSLRNSVGFVRQRNNWKPGEPVRLIFHVYKPLKRKEIQTAKALVRELVEDRHPVEYAFIDVSTNHPWQLFDLNQEGKTYWSHEEKKRLTRGICAPLRGRALLLGPRQALLQLVGRDEVKTWDQGLPRPLLLELHPDSDFKDVTYLTRQVFHFSYMSWQSFFPANEPVTVLYSRWIANLLGNLRMVQGWDGAALAELRDRQAMWFL